MLDSKILTMPQIIVENNETQYPLSIIGIRIIDNMRINFPNRYWELIISNSLQKTVYERELELIELKLTLIKEIEKKFPRPLTNNFIEIANHMNIISDIVDDILLKYINFAI